MNDAGDSHLEDFRAPVPDRDDSALWFRRSLLEGGERADPNAKHRMSLWREAVEAKKR